MKKDKIIRGMVIVFLCSVNICGLKAQEKAGECVPTDLKCEHLVAPLGIDRQAPRFRGIWKIAGAEPFKPPTGSL